MQTTSTSPQDSDHTPHTWHGRNSAGEPIDVTWNGHIVVVEVVIHDTPQPAHYHFKMDDEEAEWKPA